jgi:hypothetical protein
MLVNAAAACNGVVHLQAAAAAVKGRRDGPGVACPGFMNSSTCKLPAIAQPGKTAAVSSDVTAAEAAASASCQGWTNLSRQQQ